MKKFSFSLTILLCMILLSGCVETNILDKIALTTLVGYDVGKEEEMSTTAVIREVTPEFQSNVQLITTENDTSKGNRLKTNRKVSRRIISGQMRVILFGEELAKTDIQRYIDTSLESATVSNALYMAVVEGEVAPFLEYEYPEIEDIGQHIFKLLEQNIEQEYMISSTLHEVGHDFYSVGKDFAMPILKKEEDIVDMSGIAIFKGGKMVSKLPAKDSFFVKLIRENFKSGIFDTKLKEEDFGSNQLKNHPEEVPIAFDAIHTKRKWKLVDADTPEFDLELQLKARVEEIYPDVNMGDPKVVKTLEKAISKNLTREVSRVIAHTQEVESDIFGFGEKYRSSVRHANLTKKEWHKKYKEMKVNVKVDFVILRNGVFE